MDVELESNHIDLIMSQLAEEMKIPYLRCTRTVETLLCESFENRSLKKKDTFCKGQHLFQLAKNGVILVKNYGPKQAWYPKQRSSRRLSFLKSFLKRS